MRSTHGVGYGSTCAADNFYNDLHHKRKLKETKAVVQSTSRNDAHKKCSLDKQIDI